MPAKTDSQATHRFRQKQRRTVLGTAQLIMLGELAVNRVLNNLELPQ
ncbi:hypothetical protein [Pseudomonas baetica]|nr:hypothetical protein [Pseudomonas baetica]